tara:strand:- start:2359 stop:2472 length:114 start_codon:yes stop_codon:yes gene_type:complete
MKAKKNNAPSGVKKKVAKINIKYFFLKKIYPYSPYGN